MLVNACEMLAKCLQNACDMLANACKMLVSVCKMHVICCGANPNSQTKTNKNTMEMQNILKSPNPKTTHFRTGRSRTSGPLGSRTQDSDLGPDRVGPRSERSEWVWAHPEVRTPQGQVRLRSDFWKSLVRLLPDPPLTVCRTE